MKTTTEFPHRVVEHADVGIVMPDGCRLSARIWMPAEAPDKSLPAIIEHLPYRKRDGTTARDEVTHPWFAGHGYACLRIDMRGNGESEGIMDDEYTEQEWQDACDVIDWAVSQPWCNGRVGMMGISWGGFNALQVAALAPPALKAVITLCSSADRFADDIHYKGGCLLTENIAWAANMLSYSSRPPDKALVGESWRDMWMERLETLPFLASRWHQHQHRDSYWKRGSVCENPAAIQAAVLAMGGWHDGYRNTVSRLLTQLEAPSKGIMGPWIHKYPHLAGPRPAIGFLQEARRWWDHWLKDADTGVQNEPDYRLWLMDSVKPDRWLPERPGRWIAEPVWPSASITEDAWELGSCAGEPCEEQTSRSGSGTLSRQASRDADVQTGALRVRLSSPQDCGSASGEYFPFAFGPELPDEQSADDARSAVFDGPVLDHELSIVGAPGLTLSVQSNQPFGLVCVRLCDLRPDGESALITLGLLNLPHRYRSEVPEPIVPGHVMDIELALDQIAYRVPAGHRLRVAISTSYWPFVWPARGLFELVVSGGTLHLPTRPEQRDSVSFEEPEGAAAWAVDVQRKAVSTREVCKDDASGMTRVHIVNDFGEYRDRNHGLLSGSATRETWSVHPDDPLSATARISWQQTGGRDDWQWSTDVQVAMQCDAEAFHIQAQLTASEAGVQVFTREYIETIARKLV